MDDFFQNPDDKMGVHPDEMGPLLNDVMVMGLAKRLAGEYGKPWSDKQESKMEEAFSALVAAANERGLETILVTVTRPNGRKVSREFSVERISKTRSLQ